MARKSFISIANFDKYQHYRGDNMVWAKLYVKLLHDFDFMRLKDNEKWTFVGLLLLACEQKNRIAYDIENLERTLNTKGIINSIKSLKSINIIELVYNENRKTRIREDKIREEKKREDNNEGKPRAFAHLNPKFLKKEQ